MAIITTITSRFLFTPAIVVATIIIKSEISKNGMCCEESIDCFGKW